MDQIILIAREGYKYTDGTIYGSRIHLGKGRSVDEFYEITIEEYDEIMKALDSEVENI